MTDTFLQPDSGAPRIPFNGPLAPAGQPQDAVAPEFDPTVPPQDAGERLMRLAIALLPKRQPQPPVNSAATIGDTLAARGVQAPQVQPGRAQQIGNAVQGVLSNLGDAAAATAPVPAGGGGLTGVLRTLGARQQRLSQEESNKILHAETQARTIALMRNIHRQDAEARTASYKQGADFINQLKADHDVQENITQDELTKRIHDNPDFAHDFIVKPVGEHPVLDGNGVPMVDQNGNPVMSPLYSVASIKTKSTEPAVHVISSDDRSYIKRNTGVDLPENTNLDLARWNLLYTQAHAAQDASDAIRKSNDGQLTDENMRQVRSALQNDTSLQHYAMSVPGYPLVGLRNAAQNVQAHLQDINNKIAALQQKPGNDAAIAGLQQQKQQFIEEGGKIGKVMMFGFTDQAKKEADDYQLKVQKQAEEARHNRAEEANKRAELAQKSEAGSTKPVYAYNTQTKEREQTTRADVANNPGLYTNPVDIKETDIRKDTELARQLGDAQMNISRYRASASQLDNLSLPDKRAIAALIGEDKFKAHFMGAEIPADWLNNLLTDENWRMLSKPAQNAVADYIGARGAVIAYQKAVSGSGRSNKEQLQLELQNIPNPILPKDVRERQFERFQQNIDQTGAGLPKMVGIDRPKEIRQRIEAEEAQKQQDAAKQSQDAAKQRGATHVYDPQSKRVIPADAEPIVNWYGKRVGYQTKDGQKVMFQ